MFFLPLFALVSLSCLFGHGTSAFDHDIPGINTNHVTNFHCPSTTSRSLSHNAQQAEMNRFAYLFYVKKDLDAAFNQYVASNYVQHNPDIRDGRGAAVEALTPLFGSVNNTFEVARVMVGPEYTTIHIKANTKSQASSNVFDVYRTIGSCIVEHWDCLEEIANNTVSTHPYF